MSDYPIAGSICPGENGKPVFKVIRHAHEVERAGPNVRPCDHRSFVLDAKFNTATCDDCRERVDPFAVLLMYADWEQQCRTTQYIANDAERRLYVAKLKTLRDRKATTPARLAEIAAVLSNPYRANVDDMAKLCEAIQREHAAARDAKRSEKRKGTKAGL